MEHFFSSFIKVNKILAPNREWRLCIRVRSGSWRSRLDYYANVYGFVSTRPPTHQLEMTLDEFKCDHTLITDHYLTSPSFTGWDRMIPSGCWCTHHTHIIPSKNTHAYIRTPTLNANVWSYNRSFPNLLFLWFSIAIVWTILITMTHTCTSTTTTTLFWR